MAEEMNKLEKEQYWSNRLNEWKASGIGLEKWCKQHNHAHYKVRYWKRKLFPSKLKDSFLEIKDESAEINQILVCVGDIQIRVERGYNSDLLRQVLQTLGAL